MAHNRSRGSTSGSTKIVAPSVQAGPCSSSTAATSTSRPAIADARSRWHASRRRAPSSFPCAHTEDLDGDGHGQVE